MKYKPGEIVAGWNAIVFRKVLSVFPLKFRYKFFESVGMAAYYLIKKRRELTIDNIKHAFPENSEEEIINIATESYKTMGKMVMTSIYLKEVTSGGNTVLENEELMLKACENDKAVIIVSLHSGGFEAGSIMRNIRKFYAVFRKQKNRKLNDLMAKWREEGGLHSIALRDSETLNDALRNKTIIALASDHYAEDIPVKYFGRETTAVSGPVLLGLKYKVPLVLAYSVFENGKIKIINKEIIEIEKKENLKETVKFNMQKIFYKFEEIVKENPGQYMWQHKRWRS